MISYAGIPLTVATPDQAAWIEANISPRDVYEFEHAAFPGLRRGVWALPGHLPERRIKVNSLFWPRGASRWAVGHFLITEKDAATLSLAAAKPLVLTDGTNSHTVNLWALPPRPLSSFPSGSGWHLLTLVDDRYFWWEKAADIAVDSGTTTWAQLYTAIGAALGITLTHDAISADYLKPGRALSSRYEYLPLLLDAVAYNVGQRVIRRYDGTVHAQGPTAAATSQTQQLAVAWPKLAGGTMTAAMVRTELPPKVGISFPKWIIDEEECEGQFSATDVHWEEAAIPGTHPETTKFYRDTAVAVVSLASGEVLNEAELEGLTARVAADWYAWQLAVTDVAYVGVRAWTPEGMSDGIEWSYYPGAVATRIQRPAWNDLTDCLNHSSDVGALSSISTSGCLVDPPVGDVYIFIDNTFIENLFVTNVDIDVLNIFNEFNVFNVTINYNTEINIYNEFTTCDPWSATRTLVATVNCVLRPNGQRQLLVQTVLTTYGINQAGCYFELNTGALWHYEGCCDCPDDSGSTSGSDDECLECCGVEIAPTTWVLTLENIENPEMGCDDCDELDQTYILVPDPTTSCTWIADPLPVRCALSEFYWTVTCDETTLRVGYTDPGGAPQSALNMWAIDLEDVDWSGGPNQLLWTGDPFEDGMTEETTCEWPTQVTLYAVPCADAPPPPPPPPPPECCDPEPPDTIYFNIALFGLVAPEANVWNCFAQPANENIELTRDGSGYVWVSEPGAITGCCGDDGITVAVFCQGGKWHVRIDRISLSIKNLQPQSCDPFALTGLMPLSMPVNPCFTSGGTGEATFSVTEDPV